MVTDCFMSRHQRRGFKNIASSRWKILITLSALNADRVASHIAGCRTELRVLKKYGKTDYHVAAFAISMADIALRDAFAVLATIVRESLATQEVRKRACSNDLPSFSGPLQAHNGLRAPRQWPEFRKAKPDSQENMWFWATDPLPNPLLQPN